MSELRKLWNLLCHPFTHQVIRETSVKCSSCVCVRSCSDLFPLTTELPLWVSVQNQEKQHVCTQAHTHTDTQTQRVITCRHTHRDTHTDIHTCRETHRHTHTDTHRCRHTQTYRPRHSQANTHTNTAAQDTQTHAGILNLWAHSSSAFMFVLQNLACR